MATNKQELHVNRITRITKVVEPVGFEIPGVGRVWTQEITPEIARDWLSRLYPGQRTLRDYHVKTIDTALEDGNFVFNGDTIKINSSWQLVDGQHRLEACVQSGVPIEHALVVMLEDPRAPQYIDTVIRSRTQADIRRFNNQAPLNAALIAAVTLEHCDFVENDVHAISKVSRNDLVEACPHTEALNKLYSLGRQKVSVTSPVLGAVLRCMVVNETAAVTFFTSVFNNTAVIDDKLCLQARLLADWLLKDSLVRRGRDRGVRANARVTAYKTIMAYNAWRENRPIAKLQSPHNDFVPEPLP